MALEPPLADPDQAHVVAQDVGDDRVGRLRDQDLVADGPPPQLCASVDCGRTVVAVLGVGLPGENCHPNGERDVIGPPFRHQRRLGIQRRRQRIGRAMKNREEAVALAALLEHHAVVGLDRPGQEQVVAAHRAIHLRSVL